MSFLMVSGVAATRVSPGAVSMGTKIFTMSVFLKNRIRPETDDGSGSNALHQSIQVHASIKTVDWL
jgi:hypothetical protein